MLLYEFENREEILPEGYETQEIFDEKLSDLIEISKDEFEQNVPNVDDSGFSDKRVYLYDEQNDGYLIYDDATEDFHYFSNSLNEHEMIWGRDKTGLKLKWRCTSGSRKGRIVPDVASCSKMIDTKKRETMKLTRAKTKIAQARKSKKTKRVNPFSKMLARLNKAKKK